jgi:hypothetical protein
MNEDFGSGSLLTLLLRIVPEKARQDTQEFMRACIVLFAPVVLTLTTFLCLFDHPVVQTPLLATVLLLSSIPILLMFGNPTFAGFTFVAVEYFISYRQMELVGPEFGYATPGFFLPLVRPGFRGLSP